MDFKSPAETVGEIIFERYVWLKPLIAVVESYIKRYNWNIMFIIEYYTHNFLFLRNSVLKGATSVDNSIEKLQM